MPFESDGERSFSAKSPGGFEFGLQGWTWGDPRPVTITFFLDNTAMVTDQYGRPIRRAIMPDGRELRLADKPPEANRENTVSPRPQFATHKQVIEALTAERINWLAYEVRWLTVGGRPNNRTGLTLEEASKLQLKLIQENNLNVVIARVIECAGWPQLPYEVLKTIGELPPTPIEELRKISDPTLRKDAIRLRKEADEARKQELAAVD